MYHDVPEITLEGGNKQIIFGKGKSPLSVLGPVLSVKISTSIS